MRKRTLYVNEGKDLRIVAEDLKERLKPIKLFLTDVDGILTNGKVSYEGAEIGFNRKFHVHDGFGLKMLRQFNIQVGVITGGNSLGLKKRLEDMKVDYAYLGDEDKRSGYNHAKKASNLSDEEILYIGDELFDVPLLKKAGFSATVPGVNIEVLEVVDYVTYRKAGEGCVREVIDLIRYAQKLKPNILDFED